MMRTLMRSALMAVLVTAAMDAHAGPQAAPQTASPSAPSSQSPAPGPTQAAAVTPPRAKVVAIMTEAGQALLLDSSRGQYVVVRSGESFQGFTVTSVDTDQVILSSGNHHFVLVRTSDTSDIKTAPSAAPAPAPAPGSTSGPISGSTSSPAGQPVQLVDPYAGATSAAGATATLDPYAGQVNVVGAGQIPALNAAPVSGGARSTGSTTASVPLPAEAGPTAGPAAGASPVDRPASAPVGTAPVVASNDRTQPRVTAVPRTVVQSQAGEGDVREERYTLGRQEFDGAVMDFQALSKEVKVDLISEGVSVVDVSRSSLVYRMGLRAGDVILSVDGHKIASLDDAAAAYARLMGAQEFSATVRRGNRTILMRYRFA